MFLDVSCVILLVAVRFCAGYSQCSENHLFSMKITFSSRRALLLYIAYSHGIRSLIEIDVYCDNITVYVILGFAKYTSTYTWLRQVYGPYTYTKGIHASPGIMIFSY